ncbi:MAG: hypothetical protein LBH56_00600, partial [Coriobacteriales bacterium]|nr:hypothetical protein [Coriobacteriales bacterium]
MILFAIVPPATASGQRGPGGPMAPNGGGALGGGALGGPGTHSHSAPTPATPAKPKRTKEPGPLKKALDKLNLRERVMLGTLFVLVIVALLTFFVALPAIEKINALELEIAGLQEQKDNIHIEPDRTPQYLAEYEAALQDLENYRQFYYPFMDPETIDRTITELLLEYNLHPIRLSMSPPALETLDRYSSTQTLEPRPVETTEEANANGSNASDEGNNGDENGTSTNDANAPLPPVDPLDTSTPGGGTGTGANEDSSASVPSSIFTYTIDIEARGWMDALYTFLARAKGIVALEVLSYSYAPPPEEPNSTTSSGSSGSSGSSSS